MAKPSKGGDAKLEGLNPYDYGSQLPKEVLLVSVELLKATLL